MKFKFEYPKGILGMRALDLMPVHTFNLTAIRWHMCRGCTCMVCKLDVMYLALEGLSFFDLTCAGWYTYTAAVGINC